MVQQIKQCFVYCFQAWTQCRQISSISKSTLLHGVPTESHTNTNVTYYVTKVCFSATSNACLQISSPTSADKDYTALTDRIFLRKLISPLFTLFMSHSFFISSHFLGIKDKAANEPREHQKLDPAEFVHGIYKA